MEKTIKLFCAHCKQPTEVWHDEYETVLCLTCDTQHPHLRYGPFHNGGEWFRQDHAVVIYKTGPEIFNSPHHKKQCIDAVKWLTDQARGHDA